MRTKCDAAREFPRELYLRAAELGFLGLKYPGELGRQGGDSIHDAVWAEELVLIALSGSASAAVTGLRPVQATSPSSSSDRSVTVTSPLGKQVLGGGADSVTARRS